MFNGEMREKMAEYYIEQICFVHGILNQYHEDCPNCNHIYPNIITPARYGGVYEGDIWVALPCYPEEIPEAAFGDDISCMDWWSNPTIPVGVGNSPNNAYLSMVDAVRKHLREV